MQLKALHSLRNQNSQVAHHHAVPNISDDSKWLTGVDALKQNVPHCFHYLPPKILSLLFRHRNASGRVSPERLSRIYGTY